MFPAILISALLGFAAWYGGADESEPQRMVLACLGGGVAVTLGVCAFRPRGLRAHWDWTWGAPLLGLLVLIALQALNASHRFLPDSRTLIEQSHVKWLPRSVDGGATWGAWRLSLGYIAMFWLAHVWLVERNARQAFVLVQVACAVVLAVLVIGQRGHPPPGALYPVTGTFVNPNHYAAYADMALALALLWGMDATRDAWRRGRVVHVGWLLFAAVPVIGASILRSGSRMGLVISMIMVCLVAGWVGVRLVRQYPVVCLACGLGVGVVVLALLVGHVVPRERLVRAERSVNQLYGNVTGRMDWRQVRGNLESRWAVDCAVASMVADRWVSGVGAGTFNRAFPYYQPRSLPGFYRHAHNEYLQCLAELGVVGVALLIWAAYGVCRPKRGVVERVGHELSSLERLGIVLALGVLGFHAMTDFPLRLPAIGLLAASLIGMCWGACSRIRPVSTQQNPKEATSP